MIAAFAPGSVSNVGCGFDVLGFALEAPGDIVMVEAAGQPGVEVVSITGDGGRLPRDPRRNTATVAIAALCERLGAHRGIRVWIEKGLPLASGMGSSGASAVAAVVAANELLGRPAPMDVLLECAMAGEIVACGAAHPDNVGPSLYGGLILARGTQPPDIVRLPVPEGLACALVHPHLEVETGAARAILGDSIPLRDAVRQWANMGALVAGLFRSDLSLISRALEDHVAEPRRAHLVPGFAEVKRAALAAGALGCSLSGSGPSIFALCANKAAAEACAAAMREAFARVSDVTIDAWISDLAPVGARLVSGH
jgi:homoserine kinase